MCQTRIGFLIMYFALALVMLIIEYVDWATGRYIVKPLLTIILMAYLFSIADILLQRKLIILALLFSCIGDSLLMFPSYQNAFMCGLVAFLIAHICYIVAFYRDIQFNSTTLRKSHIATLGVVLFVFGYVGLFYAQIQSNLGEMRVPVIVYMAIISFMVIMAFTRRDSVSRYSFICVLFGAIMFVLSDSLLAINQFVVSLHTLNILVILTYVLAQFFIVHGMVNANS